ncbi:MULTISPECIES: hypothetical protein [unclassified Cryobacterium]|uniref:hypothetical protein n=1 Tax=unclassified Cryobacterium TaxID=2649013 RepID=UPI00106AC7DB|nr:MULTISPECIES: hypothetical protein [unclassified Cryobacterium]TFC59406.1 hypothetical protein E3O68_00460 [Cryobacterium sp. TMB3-1-2]TFC67202.1 hypothetical protein E3T21_17155 [Cryobacterium sp. TMB3-15]TFC73285.1 hypothetical protein E3T22_16900 [Cryobacterium sp. TMB3-10]TFD46173.1 hypothetical protein E3T58_01535 [Cryobacterium sp. TMB3-12]
MITASLNGRNLHLHLGGIEEDFVITPLGGRDGQALTDEFLRTAIGVLPADGMEGILRRAVGPVVFERVKTELSLNEGEDILLPAFYWQTVLGMHGVNAYITGGEGLTGAKKALELLALTLGILPTQTAPSGALENLIQSQVPTLRTARPTTTLDKLPASKPRANRKPKSTKPQASQP